MDSSGPLTKAGPWRILPILLAHYDKFDGSGYSPTRGEEIPLEARIIAVADVYSPERG